LRNGLTFEMRTIDGSKMLQLAQVQSFRSQLQAALKSTMIDIQST